MGDYLLVLDPEVLARPVAGGGLGLTLNAQDIEMIHHLDMSANRPDGLDLMARIGTAWAEAIGEDFARPHYLCASPEHAYPPPASPP